MTQRVDSRSSWRSVRVVVLAVALAHIFLLIAVLLFDSRSKKPVEKKPTQEQVAALPTTAQPAFSSRIIKTSTSATSAPKRRLLASDPDPIPSVRYRSTERKDPFEDEGEHGVKLMATHGAIKVGVSTQATVKDEKQVKEIMAEMARELDEAEAGRTDDVEERAHDYQPLLNRYAAKLQSSMSGAFAFHGENWILFHSVKDGETNANK